MVNIFKCLDRNDLIPVIANVLFFMVVQLLFFKYVASKQYEEVLLSKIDFINYLQKDSPTIKKNLQEFKTDFINKNKDKIEEQTKQREKENEELTKIHGYYPIIIVSLIMLHLIFIVKSKRSWNKTDNLSLLFVTLAYCTELFFFFFIVRKYEFVGDNYILSKIINNLTNIIE